MIEVFTKLKNGFKRVTLKPGESRRLNFTITPEMSPFYNDKGTLTLEPGEFKLEVGSCSPSQRGQYIGVPKPVVAMFEMKSPHPVIASPEAQTPSGRSNPRQSRGLLCCPAGF